MKNKIEAFAKNGGIAIISARSGTKDKNAHYRPLKAPGVFRNIAGCRVDWFTALSTYDKQSVVFDNKEYKGFEPEEWSEYENKEHNVSNVRYFINEWNGTEWEKQEIREGCR